MAARKHKKIQDSSASQPENVNAPTIIGATRKRESYSRRDMMQQSGRSQLIRSIALVGLVAVIALGAYIAVPRIIGLFDQSEELPTGDLVDVFIPEGASTREIAQALKDAGVISNVNDFVNACRQQGATNNLKPGSYELVTGMAMKDLIDSLVAGPPDNSIRLTIPEGLNIAQTAAIVEANCSIPAADFIAEAHNAAKYIEDYPFLEGCYDNSLEGFLYPKTYQIPPGKNAEYVIRKLLSQFAIETDGLDLSYAESRGLSLYDILVIASLVEKETYLPDERAKVSSVIYNRMDQGMLLQIDATIIYALADPERDYADKPLLNVDLDIESPYNTYRNAGLPAGPICSPQILSIQAAAQPEQTDYFYYVLTSKDGTHTFSVTYAEHEEAVKVYNQVFGQD